MPADVLGTLVSIHRQLAQTGVLYMFACGLWGLVMSWRKRPMDANYRGILVIGYVLGDVIGLFGVLLLLGGARPEDALHILYGVLAALSLPAAAAYLQEKPDER